MSLSRFLDHPFLSYRAGTNPLWQEVVLSVGMVFSASCLSFVLIKSGFPSPESLGILFVLPVLCAAIFLDLRLALTTVILSVLAYNWVLIPPYWTLDITNPQALAKVVVLLIVSLVVSALTARLRRLTGESQARENVLKGLYELNKALVGKTALPEVCRTAETCMTAMTDVPCQIILKSAGVGLSEKDIINSADMRSDDTQLVLPLKDAAETLGVLVFTPRTDQRFPLERFPSQFLPTLADQVASALGRAILAEAHEAKARQADREQFMSAMLSSLSHDFKTPLVGIMGAMETLQTKITADAVDILSDGLTEAQRLNRYVVNLIEISRLEAGVKPRSETLHIRDTLSGALRTLRPFTGAQNFTIRIEPDFPFLNLNPSLFELVLLNLIENALKYGPPVGDITIHAYRVEGGVFIDVDDDGQGIPIDLREQVFTKFYRASLGDRKIAGTGLGLYICREIVAAYGGNIRAVDPPDGTGACMRVFLPSSVILTITLPVEDAE